MPDVDMYRPLTDKDYQRLREILRQLLSLNGGESLESPIDKDSCRRILDLFERGCVAKTEEQYSKN